MKLSAVDLAGACLLLLCANFPASAQVGPGAPPRITDCSAARDPARCEAVVKAKLQCQDVHGARKQACLEDNLPPKNCAGTRNHKRCEAQNAARAACMGTIGVERRDCKRAAIRQSAKK